MPNAEQLLYQTEKSSQQRFSIKNTVLKNFAIFTGKHPYEIFENTYFKEHLRTTASELTLRSTAWNLVSGSHLKPSRFSIITKIPVAFKSELLKTLAHIPQPLRFLVNLGFVRSSLTATKQKANACSPSTPC